jgi:ubiquinone/menaquinone biosynthesis C-methylase UbiE
MINYKLYLSEKLKLIGHSSIAKIKLYKKISENSHYSKGILLDIGCGNKPYFKLFQPYVKKYIGLDFQDTAGERICNADVIGDALGLPFDNNYFDTVLSTEVLEHVPEPQKMFHEIFRVLKPGGILILSTPLLWPIHEAPYDYFRYTPYGLRFLSFKSGFKIKKIVKTMGIYSTIGQILSYNFFTQHGKGRHLLIKIPIVIICLIIQLMFSFFNFINRNKGDSLNHVLIAFKPRLKNQK